MKYWVLFYLLTFCSLVKAQSSFDVGFKDGFSKGYCYTTSESSVFCSPPLPPLPPLPQINERRDSYQDGYNRGFLYGVAQRKEQDNGTSNRNSQIPKFNPYVPQSPMILLTPEERAAYYESRARQDQATAEAIAHLLEYIFTTSPEAKVRRANAKIKREDDKLRREEDRQKLKESRANQFFVGSESYNKCKKSRNIWLTSALITGAAGTFSYLKANNYNTLYKTTTYDAASIAKKSDTYYTVASICLGSAGLSALGVLVKNKKINNAKAKQKTLSFYPQIMPNGGGLFLKFNF